MKNPIVGSMMSLATVVVILALVSVPAVGQAPTAAWDPPRTPDGQPDIQGYWSKGGGTYDIVNGPYELHDTLQGRVTQPWKSLVVDPADGKIPYQPWAAAKQQDIYDNHTDPKPEHLDPDARCYLPGVPRINYGSLFQIVQAPGYVLITYEFNHVYRFIPLDGRPHVADKVKLWMGDSRGRWEGNTLVVDVTNHNGRTWFDVVGDFTSDALHLVERFALVDPDTLHYEATLEDANVYMRPWKMGFTVTRQGRDEPGFELLEDACHEGNKAVELMLGRDHIGKK